MKSTARLCDVVQLAIIDGIALDEPQRIHRDACTECRFLADMSRSFSRVARSARGSGVFSIGITAALQHASDSGEPLFGRYRLEALCGRGGQGMVYRALDLETRERVAVKLVRAGGDSEREAGNARRIRHPNVCGVYHTEHQSDLRLIVMEWIDGPTLAERVGQLGGAALAIVRGICAGVAAAHAEDVLHLDLKPTNVLLRAGGEPVVTDFGLSVRQSDSEVYATGGTPRYMAPEQLAGGAVDKRSDVYALGRLAEELLAKPSRRQRRAIRRATAADPAARFADAAAFAAALAPVRRGRAWIAGIAAGTALAIAGAVFVAYPVRGPRAAWDPALWGPDLVPETAWNVARNTRGEGLPRVETREPMYACGQRPYDLLDGIAQYNNWEHGVAFTPSPSAENPEYACVSLDMMGACGELDDDDPLCEFDEASKHFRIYPGRGRDVRHMVLTPERLAHLGKAVRKRPCGEREITILLDDAYLVFALRVWHHAVIHTPHRFRIELHDERGGVHVEATNNNPAGTHNAEHLQVAPWLAPSAPVTTRFAPVLTREIHYIIDTCSTLDPPDRYDELGHDNHEVEGKGHPGHGWLYEVEVFAPLPRWQAWARLLRGR